MYVLTVLYVLYLRLRICTRPIRRAQARHYCGCRRHVRVHVQGKLSRSEKHLIVNERTMPTHAGSFTIEAPFFIGYCVQARWRALASHMERVIRCLGFSYGRTQHYIGKPSAGRSAFGFSLFVGGPL